MAETLHGAPLSWGVSPNVLEEFAKFDEWQNELLATKVCNCMSNESCPFCTDEEVVPQCDLENPESCEACQ